MISYNCFGQVSYDYFYKPAKQEIEVEILYNYNDYKVGFTYNNSKYYFNPKINNYIIYSCLYIPIKSCHLKVQIGYGKYSDFEMTINYRFYNFEIDIGYSHTDKFIIELKYNLQL